MLIRYFSRTLLIVLICGFSFEIWAQTHLLNTTQLNPTLNVPRWKIYANPANPYELWLIIADDHDQFFKSDDAGASWTAFDDTAANTYDTIHGGELYPWINYHTTLTGHGTHLWASHPHGTHLYLHEINPPGEVSADLGLPEEILTDPGLKKRSNIVATSDELFVITRTTNNAAGNVRYFRFRHDGSLLGSGWVENLSDANVRIGSTLDSQGVPVVAIWSDGARIEYYRWNGSAFTKPVDSTVWNSGDPTTGCSNSALTREFALTVAADNMLHVVWSCTGQSVEHAFKRMGASGSWSYDKVIDHPQQDNFQFRAALTHRGADVWMFVSLDLNNNRTQSNIWFRRWDGSSSSWTAAQQLTFDNAENRQPNTLWEIPAGSPSIPFMYWKGRSAVYTDRLKIGGAGSVPTGGAVGEGLRVEKVSGGEIKLSWGASCLAADSDYGVYEGRIGDFSSHLPLNCSTLGALSETLTPGSGNVYFLVVPQADPREGSYGIASDGRIRPASSAACLEQEWIRCP